VSLLRLFQRRTDETWWNATLHCRRSEVLSLRQARLYLTARGRSSIPRDLLYAVLSAWLWRLAADHVFKRLRCLWYRFNLFSFGPGPIGEAPPILLI
jgi:hypothetical protein